MGIAEVLTVVADLPTAVGASLLLASALLVKRLSEATHAQPLFALERAGFIDRLGRENVCADIDSSLERAREILQSKPTPTQAQ